MFDRWIMAAVCKDCGYGYKLRWGGNFAPEVCPNCGQHKDNWLNYDRSLYPSKYGWEKSTALYSFFGFGRFIKSWRKREEPDSES
jgi:hypothetical protein